jgi:hypothetical protein
MNDSVTHQRLRGESSKAYEAFRLWLGLGPERSLPSVAQKLSKSLGLMKRWSSVFAWSSRLLSYETEQTEIQNKADICTALCRAEKRQARRDQIEEEAFKLYEKLRDRSLEMLNYPLAKKVVETGTGTTLIMPTKWRIGDTARLVQMTAIMGRVAAGEGLAGFRGGGGGKEKLGVGQSAGTPGVIITIEGGEDEEFEMIPLPPGQQ